MKSEQSEQTAFTEDHSRALMINGLVEFNLIPHFTADMEIPITVNIMARGLLPPSGNLAGFRKEPRRNLLLKMLEWPNKKSLTDQQQFYQELATLSDLKIDLLTPPYLKQRQETKCSLKSQLALNIADQITSSKSPKIIEAAEESPADIKTFIRDQFRMFSRVKEDYRSCVLDETCMECETEAEAVATLVSSIRANSHDGLYLPLNLLLAMVVGRNDFIELLANQNITLDDVPDDLLRSFTKVLNIKFVESPTPEDHDLVLTEGNSLDDIEPSSEYVKRH